MTCLLRSALMALLGSILLAASLQAADQEAVVADPKTWEFVSWAPAGGADALWHDTLGGLQAAVKMYNAHGGIAGSELHLHSLLIEEYAADFMPTLTQHLAKAEVVGVVGGVLKLGDQRAPDLIRQSGLPWLGPWSNDAGLHQGQDNDPFAILPPWDQELEVLLDYISGYYQAFPEHRGPVYLVYYNIGVEQKMAAQARDKAQAMDLDLKRAPINLDFSDWPYLANHVDGAGAVIIWISHGPAAAFIRAVKEKMPETLYLTSSLNATNRNLVVLSGGTWNGMIFPAVVRPSQDIPRAFADLLKDYGPVGLEGSYQTYLGFAQGQLLARAVSLWAGQSQKAFARCFYDIKGFPTLLAEPVNYEPNQHVMGKNYFYLAQAYGNGDWRKAPTPGAFPQASSEAKH